MKNRKSAKAKQINFASKPPRYVMFVTQADGSWTVFEDDEQALRAYRPRRGERTSKHRAFVRRNP